MIVFKNLVLFDLARNRSIPICTYFNNEISKTKSLLKPPVIINHGITIKNSEYSFIAEALAEKGYFVISIQHDLNTDSIEPRVGTVYEWRAPFWDRGVANILYVMKYMANKYSLMDFNKIILIGHSYGGDIVALFLQKYPQFLAKIISLDGLLVPFPQETQLPILYIQANDTLANQIVLQSLSTVTKILLKDCNHMDMTDRGPHSVHQEINENILHFLSQ